MKKSLVLKRHVLATSALLSVFFGTHAFAATVPDAATSTAGAGRVQEQFLDEAVSPALSPRVEVKDIILQQLPPNAENIKFTLNSLEIEGLGVYKENDVAPLYQNKLGTTVSLADIYAVATALTNKYRNEGYILTQVVVPPQTIESGTVRLKVVEGFVDKVTVEGSDDESAMRLIRAYADNIRSDNALNVKQLEKFLLLINDLPGIEARSILSPSKTRAGASDLRVIVERDPYDAILSLDNHGSRYLGPVQLGAAGSLNSFFGNNERITAKLVVAPEFGGPYELAYGSLSYLQPVNTYGTTAEFFASHTDTEPGYNLDEFDVEGRSQYFRVTAEHPFIRTRSRNLYGHVAFDWRDVESKNNLEATRHDRIRALRAGGRYEFLDTLLGAGLNSLELEASKGINIFGASDEGDVNLSRSAGDPEFFKLNAEAQRLQRITSEVNLLMAVRGQWASDALLASEEFGVGGINYGRAYDPSEIVGDDGVAGKVEVQWNEPRKFDMFEDYQLYGFYDIGKVWNQDATTSTNKKNSLASTGVGIRADFAHDIEAGAAVAFPLTRDVETQQDDDPRFYFNVSRRF
ncbi:MAG: ShlB/FhaC/HecB family hemolysin secretion/activation protein [Alphaproteobacteria bacterium]|nr:ShlB/FhaC/HecB family hemolysin secretion/activation protein [Alphaproteobacteria bacterium]